jgi:hypothetical protein
MDTVQGIVLGPYFQIVFGSRKTKKGKNEEIP